MHVPVLTKEVLEQLSLKPGENVIDATLDGGGHTETFLQAIAPNGKVLGIEQDSDMVESLKSKNTDRLMVANRNFRDIKEIAKEYKFNPDVVFFDLGMSTWHLKESRKGFSFQRSNEVLDMRFSKDAQATAVEILNSFSQEKLAQIFKEYGEEKGAKFFAKKITESRKKKRIITVEDFLLVLDIKHPKVLARIFQSLRIYINDEINVLREGLSGAFEILKIGGKIAVISYHSLEDREVKKFFSTQRGKKTKKPIVPSIEEIKSNPSSRSAKLRILWKI